MIRPELRAALAPWREAMIGAAIAALGLWAVIGSGGFVRLVGILIALLGAGLFVTGAQRARFYRSGGGPGVVQVLEGQVSYFGPFSGGALSIPALELIELVPSSAKSGAGARRESAFWVLHALGQDPLRIPTNADGSDALFDVFAGLDGIQTEEMLRQLSRRPDQAVVIWQSPRRALH